MRIKKLKKSGSIPAIFISGITLGLISAALMVLFSAFLISKNDIEPQLVRYFWVIIYFTSGAVSGLVSGRVAKSKGFLWGFITSLITSLILIIISALMLSLSVDIFIAVLIPVCSASGTLCGIISANLK